MKYSQEPWYIYGNPKKSINESFFIKNIPEGPTILKLKDKDIPNGLRIIECVNAMKGVENPKEWREKVDNTMILLGENPNVLDTIVNLKKELQSMVESLYEIDQYLENNPNSSITCGSLMHKGIIHALKNYE